MPQKNNFSIYLFATGILLAGLLIAYQFKETTEDTLVGDCLPPLFDFSFPYKDQGFIETTYSMPSISGIALQKDENDRPIKAHEGQLVVKGDDEIWLMEPLRRYTPSTKKVKEYTVVDGDGNLLYPVTLFMDLHNTLYATAHNESFDSLVFVQYNDRTDRFEVIGTENSVLIGRGAGVGRNIVEDQSERFWLVYQDNLIRFDPKTNQAEKILGEEQGYIPWDALVISSDNALFLVAEELSDVGGGEIERLDPQVIRYDIQTGDIQQYDAPPLTDANIELFIDHQERLWLNDFGYLELNHDGSWTWYQIIQSPIFIISGQSGNYRYTWKRPILEVETHNRYLWFTFSGLARLDLKTNEWCLVTRTSVYTVAKDSQENLWFISDNQLYKYEFQP
jgi:hypothetical protein